MWLPQPHPTLVQSSGLPGSNNVFHHASHSSQNPITGAGWSSLIGIVTAIVGNVLISIALNTQRYAHIKLNEEADDARSKAGRKTNDDEGSRESAGEDKSRTNGKAYQRGKSRSNGTAVKGSTVKNGKSSRPRRPSDASSNSALETDPLLPRENGHSGTEDIALKSKDSKNSEPRQKSYLRSPYWWIGIVLMTVGEAGNFLAYGFAPASIVSPLGVVALISNCIIAPFMLKERFRLRDGIGVIIAIAGAVTVVLSASTSNPKLGPHEIWRLIATWEFETYLGITATMIIVLLFASERYGDRSIFIDLGLVGLFGGYTALSTKGVASMLSYTLFRALTFPLTYLLAFVLVSTAVMQIRYLNRALQRFDATQVIPTQFVLFTLSVIIGSAILYRDFKRTKADHAGEFVGGCALTFTGVWLITSGRKQRSDEEEGDNYDEDADVVDVDNQDELEDRASAVTINGRRVSSQAAAIPSTPSANDRRLSNATSLTPRAISFETPLSQGSHSSPRTDEIPSEPASLTENPWSHPSSMTGGEGLLRRHTDLPDVPSTSQASASAPVVTAEAQLKHVDVALPALDLPSATHSHPPVAASAAAHTGGLAQLARTPSDNIFRQSLTDLVPGPLMTPLSSSLSAVVADTLRRGMDGGSIKRRRSAARARLPNNPPPQPDTNPRIRATSEADLSVIGGTIGSMGVAPEHGGSGTATGADSQSRTRGRPSLAKKKSSAIGQALGKLFSNRREKGKKRDNGGDDDSETD